MYNKSTSSIRVYKINAPRFCFAAAVGSRNQSKHSSLDPSFSLCESILSSPLIPSVRAVPEAMQRAAAGWVSKVAEKLGKQGKEHKNVMAKVRGRVFQKPASFQASQAARLG